MYKHPIVPVLFFVLALSCKNATQPQKIQDPDISGAFSYWDFSGISGDTLHDASAYSNDGICVNTRAQAGSLFFDSVGSYILTRNPSLFDTVHQFSIIVKSKLKTLPISAAFPGRHVLRKENCVVFGFGTSGKVGIWLYHNGWHGSWNFSNSAVDTNWHDVAVYWDGQKVRLYIDGVQDANELAFSYPLNVNSNIMYIGEYGSQRQEGLNGSISALAMYPFLKTRFSK